MKSFQLYFLMIVVLGLVSFTIYDKISQSKTTQSFGNERDFQVRLINMKVGESVFFAGEKVPTHRKDIIQRLERELFIQTFWHSNTTLIIKRANQWLPVFEKILKENQVPEDFKYLPVIESGLTNVVSPAGAAGFWQLMPETATQFGLEVNEEVDERYHPIKSAHVAAQVLKQAYKSLNNWTNAAASYNVGLGAMEFAIKAQRVKSYYDLYLNPETYRFVFRLIAFKEFYEKKDMLGYNVYKENLYGAEPLRKIIVKESIPNLVDFAIEQGVSYNTLREYNPWLQSSTLTIKNGKTYELELPTNPENINTEFVPKKVSIDSVPMP